MSDISSSTPSFTAVQSANPIKVEDASASEVEFFEGLKWTP